MPLDGDGTLLEDRRGVTAVVGVVLMVGLTVLLASVVGTMTFAMAETELEEPAPTVGVSFEYDADAGTVTIVHEEGPPLKRGNLKVLQDGTTLAMASGAGSSFTAGDTIVDAGSYTPGERILVVWERPGGSSTVIAASTAPA
jgi:FlaG/FlaF family flagellin (archaellin)